MARPTIMTKETLQKLNEAFAFGCTDEEACFYANIGTSTLYNYQKENPEFVERKEALKQKPILLARQEVIKGIKGNPELALKYLERKKKDEFSLRSEIAGVKNQPLQIDVEDPKVIETLLKTANEYNNTIKREKEEASKDTKNNS